MPSVKSEVNFTSQSEATRRLDKRYCFAVCGDRKKTTTPGIRFWISGYVLAGTATATGVMETPQKLLLRGLSGDRDGVKRLRPLYLGVK